MRKLKKISLFIMIFSTFFLLTACGDNNNQDKKDDNEAETTKIEGSLSDLMTKIYEEIPEEERPMMLMQTEVNSENVEYFLGAVDIEYEEALASEPGIGSIAHSVVLVRVKEDADIESIKTKIKDSVNPRKWVCVEAEEVVVKNRGNLIILIMASSNVDKLEKGFNNL